MPLAAIDRLSASTTVKVSVTFPVSEVTAVLSEAPAVALTSSTLPVTWFADESSEIVPSARSVTFAGDDTFPVPVMLPLKVLSERSPVVATMPPSTLRLPVPVISSVTF